MLFRSAFLADSDRSLALRIQEEIYGGHYDYSALMDEFALIRKQGYACTTGEVDEGVTAFAVPLLTGDGRVLASISIAGPFFRLTDEAIETYREQVMKRVQEIVW